MAVFEARELLVGELRPERSLSHSPVFQVLLAFQNLPDSRLDLEGLVLTQVEYDAGRTQFDLSLFAYPLPEGGLLIIETPNPESLVAGSVNFHRDPTHLRPVHPDTLAFLCESAGFRHVEILLLSPATDRQLFIAKTVGAWVPAVAITFVGTIAYQAVANHALRRALATRHVRSCARPARRRRCDFRDPPVGRRWLSPNRPCAV